MNGPEHYHEAQRLMVVAVLGGDDPRDSLIVAAARVHATLALAAVQALRLLRDFSTTVDDDAQLEAACAAWAEAIR